MSNRVRLDHQTHKAFYEIEVEIYYAHDRDDIPHLETVISKLHKLLELGYEMRAEITTG